MATALYARLKRTHMASAFLGRPRCTAGQRVLQVEAIRLAALMALVQEKGVISAGDVAGPAFGGAARAVHQAECHCYWQLAGMRAIRRFRRAMLDSAPRPRLRRRGRSMCVGGRKKLQA
jgi:hypothetical protein